MDNDAYTNDCVNGSIAYWYSTYYQNIYTMEGEKKIRISEGVPLNSPGSANIFLNTGKKCKSNDGTVIHLNTEKPSDVGVHINTTLSIASSKKIKLLFILNFLLSIICMVISCSIAFYYWNEMISMRRQLDVLREQFLVQNMKDNILHQEKAIQSPLISNLRPHGRFQEAREARVLIKDETISPNARKYYVEGLGEDLVFLDSSKKNPSQEKMPIYDLSLFQKEPVVVHFTGALQELNIGSQMIVGPWSRDVDVSTKDSDLKIELNTNYFTVKEGGLYLIYSQIVYLSHAPNCYFIWARQPAKELRLISTCATGDDSSMRPIDKSQLSCSVHTVARLYAGDTINIAQREPNRTLWLKPGYSYIGFIKLSS